MQKPVMYLDIDGVLWDIIPGARVEDATEDPRTYSKGANGLNEFLEFALKNFEIRWCTSWTLGGALSIESLNRLERFTNVSMDVWKKVCPSMGWWTEKYQNINLDEHLEGRPFVWVEDEISSKDLLFLDEHDWRGRFFLTDVFKDPESLRKTLELLWVWLVGQHTT